MEQIKAEYCKKIGKEGKEYRYIRLLVEKNNEYIEFKKVFLESNDKTILTFAEVEPIEVL